MSKLLFVLKRREMTYEEDKILQAVDTPASPYFNYCISSGLRNSAKFVVDMLNEEGIEAKIVEVVDNNDIDREVYAYRPTHVVIEAFWVVPEKFAELTKLHPRVKWIIRSHSEIPFLANEGIAIDWILRYMNYRNVFIAPNSIKAFEDIRKMVAAAHTKLKSEYRILYLPNYYNIKRPLRDHVKVDDTIDVGCFGAVRPLKNHLIQAVAAVEYARSENKILRFHINVARIEDAGNNALKSLRFFFQNLDPERYQLVEHGWLEHDDFLTLVAQMDIGLQASFTESFNIVAADFVSQGVPIVVSEEIEWLPSAFYCDHTDSASITDSMRRVLRGFRFWFKAQYALYALRRYNKISRRIWEETFECDW